jgi:6-pyruvoyltetrahydropterin/6-carboxytetrahydropterin synthase
MYQVAIRKKITAFHQLFGGDWGKENEHHSHDYVAEILVEGPSLDPHGYLFDIAELRVALARVYERYAGKTLNDFEELKGLNPSVERFAKAFAEQLGHGLKLPGVTHLTIKMWEDEDTWASFRTALS